MDYDTESIFDQRSDERFDEKGAGEWHAFHTVEDDKVSAFEVVSPRSSYEPRYVNIIHIDRYRTA